MKRFLLILLLAATVSCIDSSHSQSPKFKFNQVVTIKSGFYEGHTGTVVSFRRCVTSLKDGDVISSICYGVLLGNNTSPVLAEIHEEDIL